MQNNNTRKHFLDTTDTNLIIHKHARLNYSYSIPPLHLTECYSSSSTDPSPTPDISVLPQSTNRQPIDIQDEEMLSHIAISINDNSLSSNFIDYHKFGTINIQGAYNQKLNNLLQFFTISQYSLLVFTETGLHGTISLQNKAIINSLQLPTQDPTSPPQIATSYTDSTGTTKGSGIVIIITSELQKHVIKCTTFKGRVMTMDILLSGIEFLNYDRRN